PLRRIDKSIPAELETITLKCLAKEPGERYASAGEMAADLRRWISNQSIRARPPGWKEKVQKWGRRHRAMVVSAGLVFGVVAIALAVSTSLLWAKDHETQTAKKRAEDNLRNAFIALDRVCVQVAERRYPEKASVDMADQALLREVLK